MKKGRCAPTNRKAKRISRRATISKRSPQRKPKHRYKKRRGSPTRDRRKTDRKRKRTQYKTSVSDAEEATPVGSELDSDTADSSHEASY